MKKESIKKTIELRKQFAKGGAEERKKIIEEIIVNKQDPIIRWYDYEETIKEITGISSDNLRIIREFCDNKKLDREKLIELINLFVKLYEIEETRKLFVGEIKNFRNIETGRMTEIKIELGKIFRKFREKNFEIDVRKILDFALDEGFIRKCEGLYFKKECLEREEKEKGSCIFAEHLK